MALRGYLLLKLTQLGKSQGREVTAISDHRAPPRTNTTGLVHCVLNPLCWKRWVESKFKAQQECEKVTNKYFVATKLTQHEDEVMSVNES